MCCVFFFRQKTAYEMRISGWSSDVGSSDLPLMGEGWTGLFFEDELAIAVHQRRPGVEAVGNIFARDAREIDVDAHFQYREIGRASCRERVCQYVKTSVVAVSLNTNICIMYTTRC